MLPDPLKDHLETRLGHAILSIRNASGGSINRAAVIEIEHTGKCFLKWNSTADPDMFVKEVMGLQLLRKAGTGLIVPEVIDQGKLDNKLGYLLLEYIEEDRAGSSSSEDFGRKLAVLHGITNERFGLDHDNYIGKLPQSNTWHDDWTDFFIRERMEPQLKMAIDTGRLSSGVGSFFKKMYRKLPDIFPDESPGLLHGDLWGGNYFFDTEGRAVIYDPAVYFGNREIELAFTHLFGGFSSGFYKAYDEIRPLEPSFSSRREIYNLYPLLVHTNLFGGHYGRQVELIVRKFK